MITTFYLFFTNSLNITFLILLLLLIEPFLKKFLSAVCLYRLWVVLLLGLLIPFRFNTGEALFYISSPRISVESNASNELDIKANHEFYNTKDTGTLPHNQYTKDTESKNQITQESNEVSFKYLLPAYLTRIAENRYVLLSLLWILGAILLLAVKGVQYYKYLKQLKRFMTPINPEDLIRSYNLCVDELIFDKRKRQSQYRKIVIYKCSIITSPMTIGIFKPRILFPEEAYSDNDFYFILKHELIHIRRRDSLMKLTRLIVLAINWYNPFCYVLSRQLDHWCETSCDEYVTANSTRSQCLDYSKLLLKYAAVTKIATNTINMIGGKDNMKYRVQSIMEQRKKHSSKVLVALLLCIVFATVIVSSMSNTNVSASNDNNLANEPLSQVEETTDDMIATTENTADNATSKETDNATDNIVDNKVDEVTDSAADNTVANVTDNTEASTGDPVESETTEKATEVTALDSEIDTTGATLRDTVVEYAIEAEGVPYLWGSNDLSVGVDSGGFVQAIYKKVGYDLPRTSREQAEACEVVSMDSLQKGDLVFYAGPDFNEINHVCLYIGEDKIIHAKNARVGVTIQDINYRTPLCAGRIITD